MRFKHYGEMWCFKALKCDVRHDWDNVLVGEHIVVVSIIRFYE